jgi:hypothetical protein
MNNGVTWTRTLTFTETAAKVSFTLNNIDFEVSTFTKEGAAHIRVAKYTSSICVVYGKLVFKEESDVENAVETLSFNDAIARQICCTTKLAPHKKYSCKFHMHIVDPAVPCTECGDIIGL